MRFDVGRTMDARKRRRDPAAAPSPERRAALIHSQL
jgi:hypothetical protein